MKTRLIALIFLLTFLVEVRGVNTPGDPIGIPMGSEEVVSNYCLTNGQDLIIWISQYSDTGIKSTYIARYTDQKFYSQDDLNAKMQSELLIGMDELISTDYGQNMDRPFWITVWYSRTADTDLYFKVFQEFNFMKVNGVYKAPDINAFEMVLPSRIPYKLNGISWVRIETTTSNSIPRVEDSRLGNRPNIEPIVRVGMWRFLIPTPEAISAGSGCNIRISVVNSGKFEVYENGYRVPEKLPSLRMGSAQVQKSIGLNAVPLPKVALTASGGEIGRTYQVFTSTNVIGGPWVDTGVKYQVTPSCSSTNFQIEVSGNTSFFQLRSVEVMPTY